MHLAHLAYTDRYRYLTLFFSYIGPVHDMGNKKLINDHVECIIGLSLSPTEGLMRSSTVYFKADAVRVVGEDVVYKRHRFSWASASFQPISSRIHFLGFRECHEREDSGRQAFYTPYYILVLYIVYEGRLLKMGWPISRSVYYY